MAKSKKKKTTGKSRQHRKNILKRLKVIQENQRIIKELEAEFKK